MPQPPLLMLDKTGDQTYEVFQPEESAEGRDVVFAGQLLAQMMMGSAADSDAAKDIRSVHSIFARAGTYTRPIELEVETMQAGRTWGSQTITATQDKLLSRSMVLLHSQDEDLMRHEPIAPEVPDPEELTAAPALVFPGAELRVVSDDSTSADGVPIRQSWHRYSPGVEGTTAAQAVLAWATCGHLIGLSMRPHEEATINDAHVKLSTGVIAHTIHFLQRFDVTDWLLIEEHATKAALGRVYGTGRVFTADGTLVATYHQDSMAKHAGAALDPRTSM